MRHRKQPCQQCLSNERANKSLLYLGLIKPFSQMPAINKKIISYSIWASVLITRSATRCDSESIWSLGWISFQASEKDMMMVRAPFPCSYVALLLEGGHKRAPGGRLGHTTPDLCRESTRGNQWTEWDCKRTAIHFLKEHLLTRAKQVDVVMCREIWVIFSVSLHGYVSYKRHGTDTCLLTKIMLLISTKLNEVLHI